MDLPKRKPIRLPEFDYSSPGAYFVTVCTHDRRYILSRITVGEGLAPPVTDLSAVGQCVEEQILAIPKRYPTVRIDHYAIMPNHIHLLVSLHTDPGGASPSPTLSDAVRMVPGGAGPSPALSEAVSPPGFLFPLPLRGSPAAARWSAP